MLKFYDYVNYDKIGLKHFLCLLLIFLKISKDSSASYYQNNKKRLQKEAFERYQSFLRKKKKKATAQFWAIQNLPEDQNKTKACWV